MHYVYILLSKKDRQLYIGLTRDIRRRYHEHRLGLITAAKHRRPLIIIYYEAYLIWADASRRERFLKGGKGPPRIKNPIA